MKTRRKICYQLCDLLDQKEEQQAIQLIESNPWLINLSGSLTLSLAPPLYYAAQSNCLAVVKYLLDKGANIEFKYRREYTPLYIAAQNGHLAILQLLISNGANLETACHKGSTALYIAAQVGKIDIVDHLLACGASIDASFKGFTPLFVAARNGHQQAVVSLIKAGACIEANLGDGATPLYVAAQNGYEGIVDLLVHARANLEAPFQGSYTPIYIAAQNGHSKAVTSLIKAGACIDMKLKNGTTPLYVAAQNGHHETVKALLAGGANPNQVCTSTTPLHVAALNNHLPVLQVLIEHGANIDHISPKGTPLQCAARHNQYDAVTLLLINGAKASNVDFITLKTSSKIAEVLLKAYLKETRNLANLLVTIYSTKSAISPTSVAGHLLSMLQLNKLKIKATSIDKIKHWLTQLAKDIKAGSWKVKRMFIGRLITGETWVDGTPTHIEAMDKLLTNLDKCRTRDIIKIYTQIIYQLSSIDLLKENEDRHEDTAAFYKQKLTELQTGVGQTEAFSFDTSIIQPTSFDSMPALQPTMASLNPTLSEFTLARHAPHASEAAIASSSNAGHYEAEMTLMREDSPPSYFSLFAPQKPPSYQELFSPEEGADADFDNQFPSVPRNRVNIFAQVPSYGEDSGVEMKEMRPAQ